MRCPILQIVRWVLAVVLLVLLAGRTAIAQPPADFAGARIRDCRIGFDGHFKVGKWTPVWVTVGGRQQDAPLTVELSASDSDGVAMSTSVSLDGTANDADRALLYTQVGRLGSSMKVVLRGDDGAIQARYDWTSQGGAAARPYQPLPSTGELIVQLGTNSLGLRHAFPDRVASGETLGRRVVQISDAQALPTEWLGYDGVDMLIWSLDDSSFCRDLAEDERRLSAIERWLELGGCLIVCGGRTAPQWLADDRPLARFLPAKFLETVALPQTRGLENFAETSEPIRTDGGRRRIPVPRLEDVAGQVDVDGRSGDLPLVIRAPRGFGELVFVGLDLDQSPLAEWPGRSGFVRNLLQPYAAEIDVGPSQTLVSLGYDDLAGALRQRLGRRFAGVTLVAFPIVALLAVGYLLLLGPLDYLLVHKLLGRPLVAWVTFPAVVVIGAGVALWLVPLRRGGSEVQVNRAEIVDVDLSTSRVRGHLWATVYSPHARRFDLALSRIPAGLPTSENVQSLLCWLGLPGAGLGGMHARGIDLDLTETGYRLSAAHDRLTGVPVLTSSTKSFAAAWNANTQRPLDCAMEVGNDGLLVGSLTNHTELQLRDACLLHGGWAYQLGNVEPGQRRTFDGDGSLLQLRTQLLRRAGRADGTGGRREPFAAERASTDELLNVMMFFRSIGGASFAGLPSRYEAVSDMSRLLSLGRAVLVARVDAGEGGGRLVDPATGKPLVSAPHEASLYYRFVFPVDDQGG